MNLRLWISLLLLLLAGAAWWFFRDLLSLEALVKQENRLRESVEQAPLTAFIVGFLIYTAASLVPGTAGKAIVYGWLFGFWLGLLLVNFALSVAAVITFLAVRYILRDWVRRRFSPFIRHVDEAVRRDGAFYLITLRLLHVPYSVINYAAGATKVPTRTFWWTTQLGMVPGNAAVVLAGSQLPTLEQVAEEGMWSLIDVRLWGALSLTALIPVTVRWIVRRWRPQQAEPDGGAAARASATNDEAPLP